jgi:hypothetical protein
VRPKETVIQQEEPQRHPHRIRLPGFLVEEDIGLGEVTKRVAYALGVRPCGGCEKRAAALNRWIQFSPNN